LVYMRMQTQARDVIEQYYSAFNAHTEHWQDLVTDDVVFDGLVQHARGKAEFVGLTVQFLQAHRETRLLGRMAAGNEVASLFEFAIEAPNGERMTCPVAEWATVVDGKIKEFRVYYDPRALVNAFGMGD
jgi:ketosteroid isomerase-like protein